MRCLKFGHPLGGRYLIFIQEVQQDSVQARGLLKCTLYMQRRWHAEPGKHSPTCEFLCAVMSRTPKVVVA